MNKTVIIIALLAVMTLMSGIASAITAPEVFNEGKRAFDSGRWQEANEVFDHFMETWPQDKLVNDALYYFAISSARLLDDKTSKYRNSLTDSLTATIASLSKELPEKDLAELKVAVKIAKAKTTPTTWEELSSLSSIELKHYLNRGWYPDPGKSPIEALSWIFEWTRACKSVIEPELESNIALIKARALWQIMLSPLSMSANFNILKTSGCLPVHSSFENALRIGFNKGNPVIKRELALLGYHYDCLKSGGFAKSTVSPVKSRWYTYLAERGINLQEAWCPR